MPTPTDDDVIRDAAAELATCEPIGVMFLPASAFHLVGLLQLALRHPRISDASRAAAHLFVLAAYDDWFRDCPTVRAIIERGNDPQEDR